MKERYLVAVRGNLDCSPDEKEQLMARITRAVGTYLEDNPDSTQEDLTAAFGVPEACAAQLMEDCPPESLTAGRRKKSRKNAVLIGILAFLVAMLLFLCGMLWANGGLVIIERTHYGDRLPPDAPPPGTTRIETFY